MTSLYNNDVVSNVLLIAYFVADISCRSCQNCVLRPLESWHFRMFQFITCSKCSCISC